MESKTKMDIFNEKYPEVKNLIDEINERLSKIPVTDDFSIALSDKRETKTIIQYDLAHLPKGKRLEDIMFDIANDGLLLCNSDTDGSVSACSTKNDGFIGSFPFEVKAKSVRLLLTLDLDKLEA